MQAHGPTPRENGAQPNAYRTPTNPAASTPKPDILTRAREGSAAWFARGVRFFSPEARTHLRAGGVGVRSAHRPFGTFAGVARDTAWWNPRQVLGGWCREGERLRHWWLAVAWFDPLRCRALALPLGVHALAAAGRWAWHAVRFGLGRARTARDRAVLTALADQRARLQAMHERELDGACYRARAAHHALWVAWWRACRDTPSGPVPPPPLAPEPPGR